MRNELGTTNKEEAFKEGEEVDFCGESFIVLKNYGTRGKVRPLGENYTIDPFYWEYQGMEVRRVKRNVA
jgi:hypothetical protein